MPSTHDELVERAIKWLRGTGKCSVVTSELHCWLDEIPDAIGWTSWCSILIECKTSRSDFFRDKKKRSRIFPDMGLGNFRFYMTKPGLIRPEELPDGWGLLEVHPRIIRRKVHPKRFLAHQIGNKERKVLVSLLRRLQETPIAYRGKGEMQQKAPETRF